MKKLYIILLLILSFLGSYNNSFAYISMWDKKDESSARLLVGSYEETLKAGFELELSDNWKTYWRTPGDGGMPFSIDWTGSKNVKSTEVKWPAPTRSLTVFEGFEPVENFVYKKHVVFPIIITPEDPDLPIHISASINYAVCDELCVFFNSNFTTYIDPNRLDGVALELINDAIKKVPVEDGSHGFKIEDITLSRKTLEIKTSSEDGYNNPDVFVETSENFTFPKPDISTSLMSKNATFTFDYKTLLKGADLTQESAIITLRNNGLAIEKEVKFKDVILKMGNEEKSWLFILITAFIGGLILNIMPCVLPVLSLKLLGVIKHGGGDRKHVCTSFFASAAGIIFSFIALAFLVIFLKSTGASVGWGFHFQEPLFLIFLVILLNLFAANQWGLFEVNLPHSFNNVVNEHLDSYDNTPLGHFLTGVFVTILATPCSAPYLGTAIGFALSQGTQEIIITFIAMGIGLAFPYLLFAILPNLVTGLPRPGRWMLVVKHILGYMLAATSLWLIWVLSGQLGILSAVSLLGISALTILVLILSRFTPIFRNKSIPVLLLIALSFAAPSVVSTKVENIELQKGLWQDFAWDEIQPLVSEGKIVFVDVTADWCLTCKFNKLNVLSSGEVVKALSQENVVSMKADYTSPSEEIGNYLKSFNRYGIPFNVVYGPNAPKGIPLSELLTKKAVLEALKDAK